MRSALTSLGMSLVLAFASAVGVAPQAHAQTTHPWLGWSTATIAGFAATERHLQVTAAAMSAYAPFDENFPQAWADAARRRSVPLVLAWEPWDWDRTLDHDQPEYSLAGIARGVHDDYVRQWARQARDSNVAVLLRFAPEMNGDWRPWSVNDSPQDFIHAWRHLHDVFDQEGAGNVKWVFNPNVSFTGAVAIENFWPGADYVDWLGVDGYNWSGVKAGRTYENVRQVFAGTVTELRALDGGKPLMIAECAAGPDAKSRWLPDLIRTAPSLGVRLAIWFEHDKETDWRMATARLVTPLPVQLEKAGWRTPD